MTGLARSLWPRRLRGALAVRAGAGEPRHRLRRAASSASRGSAIPSNPRSWFGRSRARVATGISLTAPGIPMLFMGQEFLEDKQWSDNFEFHTELLLHWAGLDDGDKQMLDHLRFTRELIGLRWRHPALRGQGFRVVHAHDENRVLAFHRWVEGEGHDVIVVVHLVDVQPLRLPHRISGRRRVARGLQQRRLRELGQSRRRRQWRPRSGRASAAARVRPFGRARAAGE